MNIFVAIGQAASSSNHVVYTHAVHLLTEMSSPLTSLVISYVSACMLVEDHKRNFPVFILINVLVLPTPACPVMQTLWQ